MKKYLGKFGFLALIFFANNAIAAFDIKLQSLDNKEITTVEIEQRFLMIVSSDKDFDSNAIEIVGLSDLVVHNIKEGFILDLIAQRKIKQLIYELSANKVGSFRIGPIRQSLKNIKSNIANILVKKATNPRVNIKKPWIELFIDTDSPFLGQKINLKVRFYFEKDKVKFELIDQFKNQLPSNLIVMESFKPNVFETQINDVPVSYIEFSYSVYANKVDLVAIPPLKFEYKIMRESSLGSFGFFKPFNLMELVQETAISKTLTLNIKKLPNPNIQVDGVGKFKKIDVKIDKKDLSVGDAGILELTFYGEGNLDLFDLKRKISQINYDFKIILSRKLVRRDETIFEYIIQPTKSGEFELGPLEFIYFDPEKKSYSKLISEKFMINVQDKKFDSLENLETEEITPEFLPQLEKHAHDAKKYHVIAFLNLIFVVLWFFIFIHLIYFYGQFYCDCLKKLLKYHFVFFSSRKIARNALKIHRYDLIYDSFVNLLSTRMFIEQGYFSFEQFKAYLKETHVNESVQENWKAFERKILSLKYAHEHSHEKLYIVPDLNEINFWFSQLKKIL